MGKIHTRMMPLALAVALTACGGGGGGSASSGNGSGSGSAQLVTSTTLSGVAVDGYLQNAKVCLDLNDNLVCDSGEPSATTGANGSYRLTAPSLEAANQHHVIVEAMAGVTVDADSPSATITQSYVLVAPIGQHAVVSPISTLLHQLQHQGLPLPEAEARLGQLFVLSEGVNLYADFAAAGAGAEQQYLHNVARVVVRQLAAGLAGIEPALVRPLSAPERPPAVAVVLRQILENTPMVVWYLSNGRTPEAVPSLEFDFSNIEGQLAAAALASSRVSDPLAVIAGGVSVPGLNWNGRQMVAGYHAQIVEAVSTSSPPYVDAAWTNYFYDSTEADFKPMSVQVFPFLKDGRWTALTGVEPCRNVALSTGLKVSCGSGWQGEIGLRELAIAGAGIDGVLRYRYGEWAAHLWGVAGDRRFGAGAKGYLVSFRQAADFYWLTAPVDVSSQNFVRLEDAMAALTTAGGQRFFMQGIYASFDSVVGDQGELSLFGVGGEELPLKGHWQWKTLGHETVLEFTPPWEYRRRMGMGATIRPGWSVYTPTGGSPMVYQSIGQLAGTVFHDVWLNTKALDELKAARATAN